MRQLEFNLTPRAHDGEAAPWRYRFTKNALVEEFDNPAPERVRHLSYVLHDQLDEEFAQAGAR